MDFEAFIAQPGHDGRLRHVIVTEGHHIMGVLRVNTALRQASATGSVSVKLRDLASRNFTIVSEDDILFDVIRRIWRRHAVMALVISGRGVPRSEDVRGVITKEHVADTVASSVSMFPI